MPICTLTYPNFEVETSFNNYILKDFVSYMPAKGRNQIGLYRALEGNKIDAFKNIYHSFFHRFQTTGTKKLDFQAMKGIMPQPFIVSSLSLD